MFEHIGFEWIIFNFKIRFIYIKERKGPNRWNL